ncbi:MAG: LLM class oxidoreductase [Bacteroidota bacterium]
MPPFEPINRAYNTVFQPDRLSVGIVVPIENYANDPVPTMQHHLERVQLLERLGFKAFWIRDVPFHVPSFGDAGQTYDPFTYLGYLAGLTSEIALGIASIALPLHHPVHVAKSAATIDQLSGGRLILGVASGDRPSEYPAMGLDFEARGERFRDAFQYIRAAGTHFPAAPPQYFGTLSGQADILPKPHGTKVPMLITGHSRQSPEWIAEHGDGWMYYPRNSMQQRFTITRYREQVAQHHEFDRPFMQPLYVDLQEDDNVRPTPIHLGMRLGLPHLIDYFHHLQAAGVNHVALNLRFNTRPIEATLEHLAAKLLPHFA